MVLLNIFNRQKRCENDISLNDIYLFTLYSLPLSFVNMN